MAWWKWAAGAAVAWWVLRPKTASKTTSKAAAPLLQADVLDGRPDFDPYTYRVGPNGVGQLLTADGTVLTADQLALSQAPKMLVERWKTRQRPQGASAYIDEYSNFVFVLPWRCVRDPWGAKPGVCGTIVVDEFGRMPAYILDPASWVGTGDPFTKLVGDTLALAVTVAPYVAIAYPPAAPFIVAGLAAYNMRGKDFTVKNAAVAAARTQVPPQYQFAFDVGAGVAAGKKPNEAAANAYLTQYPEARPFYNQGKAAVSKAKS